MLNLLPEAYIKSLQKEYRQRVFVAVCNLVAFCAFVFTVGLLPSYIVLMTENSQSEKQNSVATIKISDEDKGVAMEFESLVKSALAVIKNTKGLSASHVDYIVSLQGRGIAINALEFNQSGVVSIGGIADVRNDLSSYIKLINDDGLYIVDDVPASTFTKDKNLQFNLILNKTNKNPND
jgi:hypothetical protein